jgi:2-dehydropantoate 2-reductase
MIRSMRVAVVGAGAIGAYVGASLARGGADVHLVARGEHLEAMRRDGVQVLSPRGDFTANPPATDDPSEIGPVDVIFLGLKAHSYATAGPLLEPLMHEETAVVAGQNGIPWWYFYGVEGPFAGRRIESVDPDGAVSEIIEPRRAIGCVVYPGTELAGPGIVKHIEGTRFSIGEPDGSITERCERFSEAMIAGGLKCPVEENIRDEIWVKLMGNAVFNPLSVLTGASLAAMCQHPQTRTLVAKMMGEALEIAHAVGARPSVSIERRLAGAERVGDHKTSTLQDFEAGKPLELAAIIDAVIELADLAEVDAPSMRSIAAASALLAETRSPPPE